MAIYKSSYNGQPDYEKMEAIISAVHKIVMTEVSLYADRKIEATKEAVLNNDRITSKTYECPTIKSWSLIGCILI